VISTLRRITPDSDEGQRIAMELGVMWSPRARTAPIDPAEVERMRFADCAKGIHTRRKNWGDDLFVNNGRRKR
jgi:hypothetical protein